MTLNSTPVERLGQRLGAEQAVALEVRSIAIALPHLVEEDGSTPTELLAKKVYKLYDTVDRVNCLTRRQKQYNLSRLVLSTVLGTSRRYKSTTQWYDNVGGIPTRILNMSGPVIDAREVRLPTQEIASIYGLITCGFVVELPQEAVRKRLQCNIYDEAQVAGTGKYERDIVYSIDCFRIQPRALGDHSSNSLVEYYKGGELVDPLLTDTNAVAVQALGLLELAHVQIRNNVPNHFIR